MLKAKIFTLAALLVVLVSNLYPIKSEEPLKLKWDKKGLTYQKICKPGKLLIANSGASQYLIDLTNGEIIYQTDPKTELGLSTNYFGDKFYLYDESEQRSKEYDVKTKEFLGYPGCVPQSPDNAIAYFNMNNNILKFYVCGNASKNDSIKIPNTPDTKLFNHWNGEFSQDGKYYALTLWTNTYPQVPYFYLYDRTSKEFIFEGKKDFVFCLFNNSSKIAYAENLKLDGDDATYSYIRIYDPDQRKVIQDIKIAKEGILYLSLRSDDKIIVYGLKLAESGVRFYNLEENKSITYKAFIPSVEYSDDKMLYCVLNMVAYEFDWIVGVNEEITTEDTILYPNPTNGILSVKIPLELLGGTWNLSDLNGKILKKGFIIQPDYFQIDVSSLIPQKYILTIQKGKLIKSYNFVKQ